MTHDHGTWLSKPWHPDTSTRTRPLRSTAHQRLVTAAFATVCLLSTPVLGAAADGPNSDAPPETTQFAFIIGEWDCKTRFMAPDSTFTDGEATWAGYWILELFRYSEYIPCPTTHLIRDFILSGQSRTDTDQQYMAECNETPFSVVKHDTPV